MSSEYEVRVEPLPTLGELSATWQELEARSRCSFFLSWAWIECWLVTICDLAAARLVSVRRNGRLVGLGILTARRRLGIGPRYLYLHEVGDRRLDDLTIEYNGLLAESGLESTCLLELVRHLRRHDRWTLLHLPGLDASEVPFEQLVDDGMDIRTRLSPAPYVDLARIRREGASYLQGLSANNRSAVRRTQRKLESAFGPVSLVPAEDEAQRQAFFESMVGLHQAHWARDSAGAGAFADERILGFHRRLLGSPSAGDCISLVRMTCGEQDLGYAYNFVWRGVVYFYQMGVDYSAMAHHGSPGLLLLARAVERAEMLGQDRFEFMAGDSRYKRALSNASRDMAWVSVDRVGWIARARHAWRGAKRLLGRSDAAAIVTMPGLGGYACAATTLYPSIVMLA